MKKFTGIALLLCLLLPLMILHIGYQWEMKQIKREIKWCIAEGLERSELQLFTFSIKEAQRLHWKHSREFEYKGQMYDVVEKLIENDSVFYWCWPDEAEDQLNQKVEKLLSTTPQRRQQDSEITRFYKGFYLEYFYWKKAIRSSESPVPVLIFSTLPQIFTDPLYPPPQKA